MVIKKTLKEWEIEKGIEIKTKDRKNIIALNERQFINLIKDNYIVTKTEKGLNYLEENAIIGGNI